MWRGQVIEKLSPGYVVVTIPQLYGDDPVGPMQSAVDASVGDRVVVADLNPGARVRDWWVIDFESTIGRWGNPYPHDHSIGQVVGLGDALAAKADDTDVAPLKADLDAATYLATPGTIPRRFDNGGFRVVTGVNPQDAVNVEHVSTNYVTKTSYNAGMAAKADAPTDWVNCTTSSYLTKSAGGDIQVRNTVLGVQIRAGRWTMATDIPMDATIFTVPSGYRPTVGTFFSFSGMSSAATGYAAMQIHVEFRTDGRVTMRHAITNGPFFTLGHIVYIN